MKNKNVILIVCDSLVYEKGLVSKMSVLSKHQNYMYSFNNYFSQAPFTEAAIVPMLTSSNVLDYKGYLYNICDRKRNINSTFKNKGFKTFNTLYFYANTIPFLKDVDEYIYTDTPTIISHFSDFRLKYYKQKYESGDITRSHLNQLSNQINNLFKIIEIFISDFNKNENSMSLLKNNTDLLTYMEILEKEYPVLKKEFEEDSEKFLNNLLKGSYSLFKSKDLAVIKSKEYIEIEHELNKWIKSRALRNIIHAVRNNKNNNSLGVLKKIFKNKELSFKQRFVDWGVRMNNYGKNYSYNRFSANLILKTHLEYLKRNRNVNNFSYIHLNETHNPFNFLSYELPSVKDEFLKLTTEKDRKSFYEISRDYLNDQLNYYIDSLEKEFGLDNTTIIITSDHGTSNTSRVYRNINVMNFQDETYHIPLFIINKNFSKRNIDNYGSSQKLESTILDSIGEISEFSERESLLRNDSQYIIFEYFGAGTPDFTERNKLFCVRSRTHKVEYEVSIKNEIKITAIYNLIKDPLEFKNLVSDKMMLNNEEVILMNEFLELRLSKLEI